MSTKKNLPIGVFDSGVGGLTVTRAITELLPHEQIIYLGDTARVPYGNRGADTVRRYALNASKLLINEGIKALVIACNTATAHGLEALKHAYPNIPIIGVISPVSREAVMRTERGAVAIIGTRGTISSKCYPAEIQNLLTQLNLDKTIALEQIACPLFVPLAEEGWLQGEVPEKVAMSYLEPLKKTSVDTLILGCTHYPMLRDTIAVTLDSIMPHHVTLLDCAQSTSRDLAGILSELDLARDTTSQPLPTKERIRFLVTDEPSGFMTTAIRFFGGPIQRPEHVNIIMEDDTNADL